MSFGGSGLRDWLFQRVTAVILTFYLLFFCYYFITTPKIEYYLWQELFEHPLMQIGTILALLSIAVHAWLGVWIIATDYIKIITLRYLFLFIVILTLVVYVVWGINILWGI